MAIFEGIGTKKVRIKKSELPRHIALTMQDLINVKNVPLEELYKKRNILVREMLGEQAKQGVPMMSFFLLASNIKNSEHFASQMDSLLSLCSTLAASEVVHQNQMRFTVLGKWYDLPGRVVDEIKQLIAETKDYDRFFVNLCINYDGQEEILDACRIIGMKIKAGKIDPEAIDLALIKENLYSSTFLAPDLIIKNGSHKLAGFLLWDSTYSEIYFTQKHWYNFTRQEFYKALDEYRKK